MAKVVCADADVLYFISTHVNTVILDLIPFGADFLGGFSFKLPRPRSSWDFISSLHSFFSGSISGCLWMKKRKKSGWTNLSFEAETISLCRNKVGRNSEHVSKMASASQCWACFLQEEQNWVSTSPVVTCIICCHDFIHPEKDLHNSKKKLIRLWLVLLHYYIIYKPWHCLRKVSTPGMRPISWKRPTQCMRLVPE